MSWLADTDTILSILIWLLFVALCVPVLSFRIQQTYPAGELVEQTGFKNLIPISVVVVLISLAAAFYIHHYQGRLIKNHIRALVLVAIFILLLVVAKLGVLLFDQLSWATGTAVAVAFILAIAYEQRSAVGLSIFYCIFACFATGPNTTVSLFLTMAAGAVTCCLSLKEIRTRMKLLEVSVLAMAIVFITAVALNFWPKNAATAEIIKNAGWHALTTITVGALMQSLLPFIEKNFRIVTSMTLLDYSDANQPLLKKLAMEAPGTFSHSLLIGSISEAAAETIDRNGLLCRVGAYYHDIGKINKPSYFVENEMGSTSRHNELSPAMSQLIIVGHVKDGIEMAKEFGLPSVLRQFIETHHGTTLIEYFYHEAKKKQGEKESPPSESEFRYAGPKPRTKEAAIVMLADAVEGAVRSLPEITPTKIETVVHNMAMKRLQDGQFDECNLSLRELNQIEGSMSKILAAHYHSRIAYPKPPDAPEETPTTKNKNNKQDSKSQTNSQ
ncbi:MAG: HD family phosphohydrolase [Planctomycetota bacterium]|jgi:putative nucleotidyltransferase with HDIG domain